MVTLLTIFFNSPARQTVFSFSHLAKQCEILKKKSCQVFPAASIID
jgi:hypothetical protein